MIYRNREMAFGGVGVSLWSLTNTKSEKLTHLVNIREISNIHQVGIQETHFIIPFLIKTSEFGYFFLIEF